MTVTLVATAGHVDHGKSTLVEALCGMNPDRLVEERRRGLTIDLGFAWTGLPSGRRVSFVDVPGHVRFRSNMLSGVGAVDACLFVVSAVEGWRTQSFEHLRVLELLGVRNGVVVLTHAASIDGERLGAVVAETERAVAGTFLAGSRVVAADAPAGRGMDTVVGALEAMVARSAEPLDEGRARVWIDRSFTMPGHGTVVTGTLTGGSLQELEPLDLITAAATTGKTVRLRSMQSLGQPVQQVPPGSRVAINLAHVGRREVRRGDALLAPGRWWLTTRADLAVEVLVGARPLTARGAHRLHVGSGERSVDLQVIGARTIEPGHHGTVRARWQGVLPLTPGDRFVLVESGRSEVLGGGEVLDVDPVTRLGQAAPDRSVDRVVAERGWVKRDVLSLLTGLAISDLAERELVGGWVVDPLRLEADRARLHERLTDAGTVGLETASLSERERALIATVPTAIERNGRVAIGSEPELPSEARRFLDELRASGLAPPSPGVTLASAGALRALLRDGRVIASEGCYFAVEAVETAERSAIELMDGCRDGVTLGQLRARWATTRRCALALVAILDDRGATKRVGDRRFPGAGK